MIGRSESYAADPRRDEEEKIIASASWSCIGFANRMIEASRVTRATL